MRNSASACHILSNTKKNLPLHKGVARTGLSLTGGKAYREISSRLCGYPAAQGLLKEVYDFYGDCLSYTASTDFTSTLYAIHLRHDPVALRSAEIQLQLGTGRTAEALTHELLHLHLPTVGFPLGELVKVPLHLNHYAHVYLSMCNWVVNVVQHEINFRKFVALGFDAKRFLAGQETPIEYRKQLKPGIQQKHAEGIDFSRWCIEYVRHVLTARHGGSQDRLRQARDVLGWGSRFHPELKQTAVEIDRCFETGRFDDPDQYSHQVNALLNVMRIPKFTGWVTLKRSEQGKPTAARSDTERIWSVGWACLYDRLLATGME